MFSSNITQKTSVSFLLSILIHAGIFLLVVQVFDWDAPWRSQAKGQAQVILLAPSPQPAPPTIGETENRQANPLKTEQLTGKEKTVITTTADTMDKAPVKATPNTQHIKDDVQAQKQVTAAQGTDAPLDTQSEQNTELSPYEQKILNHLLSKMESAPTTGSVQLELTIMKAGVAIGINILTLNGPEKYGQWVRHKALSANPYPSFSGTRATRTVTFWVRHEAN